MRTQPKVGRTCRNTMQYNTTQYKYKSSRWYLFPWMRCLFSESACLPAILDSAFPSVPVGVSLRRAGIGLGTFPIPCFAWVLSASILAVLTPLLDPSMTCPVPVYCLFVSFMASWSVLGGDFLQHWSMLWPVPLYIWFTSVGDLALTA